MGTLFGYLSADPDEEGGPKPDIFFKSFKEGFEQSEMTQQSESKRKRGTDEMQMGNKKSYFFEFISNIISSLVGGITNFVVNASLGSSGGSSQGSAEFLKGTSKGSHAGSAYASKSSSDASMNKHPTSQETKH